MKSLTDGREVIRPDAISLVGLGPDQEWLVPVSWPDGSQGYCKIRRVTADFGFNDSDFMPHFTVTQSGRILFHNADGRGWGY